MTNSNNETPTDKAPEGDNEVFFGPDDKKHFRRRFWKIPVFIVLFVVAKSAIFMALWNHLIPELFHGPTVNFGQAIGLIILAKLLIGFGGKHHGGPFGGPGPMGGRWRGRHLRHRWASMSDEERQKLRSEMRARWRGRC